MRRLLAVLAACATLAACADAAPTDPGGPRSGALTRTDAPADQTVTGEVGGARYALYRPANWNGSLVIYAHGYQHPAGPALLPEEDPILGSVFTGMRAALLSRGYALALSSFSQSGYAVKEGALATHQLKGIFTSRLGRPARSYLAGHSLGGMAALMLAERHPTQYDGALVMCSFPGGARAEVDYIYNVRAVFDFFYPGVLPGSLLSVPPVDFFASVVPAAAQAMTADPTGAAALWLLDQTRVPATQAELGDAIMNVLFFHVASASELSDRTHGHSFFDNSRTAYSGALLPQPLLDALNGGVARVSSTPDAENYIDRYYEPTGDLRIPVLTLHTSRDPVTPLWHEERYRQTVARAGAPSMLVQRTVDRYGHCALSPAEQLGAIDDLAAWAERGVRPSP